MARNLPTHVTPANWREVREAWAVACDRAEAPGIADSFRFIGIAERYGHAIDEAFCADVVAAQIVDAMRAEHVLGIELVGEEATA